MSPQLKVCSVCNQPKPADTAHFRPYDDTGNLRAGCRACEALTRKANRQRQIARRKAAQTGSGGPAVPPSPGSASRPEPLPAHPLNRLGAILAGLGARLDRLEGRAPEAQPEGTVAPGLPQAAPAEVDPKAAQREAERVRREASNYEPLGVDNYRLEGADRDAGFGANDGRRDKDADRQKKQEYSRSMGETLDLLAASGGDPAKLGAYLSALAEDERRFLNRRLARSVSLGAAREHLFVRQFKQAATEYLSGKIEPAGYASRTPRAEPASRTVNILLSDLHFGSDLGRRENPEPFGAEEESRRFGKIIAEVADYKPQHRDRTRLNVLLNGDIFEGDLGHDQRSGAPLTEQFVATWKYLGAALAHWAAVFPAIHVECQSGNHGRRVDRHPGRSTHNRWDSHEHNLYFGLQAMCSNLRNVTFGIPHRAVSVLDLHGSKMLLAHGDGEPLVKHPDGGAKANAAMLNTINSTKLYGVEFQLACFGHHHTPRVCYFKGTTSVHNGALVPPNGYARASGYVGEKCGQFLFESVEGYPLGDVRFLEVGPAEDADASLNKLCQPFRFGDAA